MKAKPGTYAVVFECQRKAIVQVGRLGSLEVRPGVYLYVGSAFGPGGVRARVLRHCRRDKPKHWHIDYLAEALEPLSVFVSYTGERLEHRWADAVGELPGVSSVKGFGCSDCSCKSHLFYAARSSDLQHFARALRGGTQSWSVGQAAAYLPSASS